MNKLKEFLHEWPLTSSPPCAQVMQTKAGSSLSLLTYQFYSFSYDLDETIVS